MSSAPTKYNNIQVALHLLTAFLIVMMLIGGHFILEATPNSDPTKNDALKSHMIIGGVILVLTLFRIVWKRKSAQPPHAETGNAFLDKLGIAAHYALNILTLIVALSGIGIAVQAGLAEIVFEGVGSLPKDFWGYPPRIAHGIFTKLLVALVLVHILGGLYHQLFLKDALFKRIWFGKSES